MSIIKRIIAPIQAQVLYKGRCPGCTYKLEDITDREPFYMDSELLFCECGRAYIYDKVHKKYRRALKTDLKQVPRAKKVEQLVEG